MRPFRKACCLLASAALIPALSGCIDDNYDLSDIDTTAQFKVNDLTLPINLDEIRLENILDLNEGSSVKVIDGKYAVVENGSLSSDPLKIDVQTIKGQPIGATRTEIFSFDPTAATKSSSAEIHYSIEPSMSTFSYDKDDVDNDIRGISKLQVDWTLSLTVSIEDADNLFSQISFSDVEMKIPTGLTTPDFDNRQGIVKIGSFNLDASHKSYTVDIRVTEIAPAEMSAEEFSFTPGAGTASGHVSIHGEVGPYSGIVTATTNAVTAVPESVWMVTTPKMSDIVVNRFSGELQYTFSDFQVPSVDINDLPNVFKQKGTDVVLANPQLYMTVNNPIASYGLDLAAGLSLTPVREGVASSPVTLDAGEQITVGHDRGIAGPYKFCISPSRPNAYYEGFEDATYVACSGLSKVLSGDGLPDQIDVDITDARVVEGHVDDFVLGQELTAVSGSYTVYCPLDLDVNSVVVYADTVDGWNDEDVDKITITALRLAAVCDNSLPFDIELTGYPIDANGARCVDQTTLQAVTIEPVTVAANSSTTFVTTTNGVIQHLDGIYFEAVAKVTTADQTLAPTTPITLTNIKVTVSGSYTDEL